MDDSDPQDIYAKCLPNNRGYPLWFPEPSNTLPSSHREDGFQIGDVGYVSRKGKFDVLCNITYGPNHALHQRPGVTFSFDPIALDIDHELDITSNADPPGCIIISPGITQPSEMSQRAGHYEFAPSSAKGAILILPDGAESHDLLANEHFRKVAMERAFDWYEFAKKRYGESISSGSLYLITGFYKARSWSLASFHDATATERRRIRVVPQEGEGTTAGREWKCTFPVHYRDGPGPGTHGRVNQTVFISGFKIAVRDDVFGWLSQKQMPEVQPVPALRPRKGPCDYARFLMGLFCKKNPSERHHGVNGGADVNHIPPLSQPFHPSDIINRYLLNKDPNALVAVTHDSEWIALIETGKLTPEELAEEGRLEEILSNNYSLVSQPENSAVYLQGKREDVSNSEVSSKSEGFCYPKPSTSNFQVVITRIRAEDVVAGFNRMPVGFFVLIQFDGMKRRTENKPVRLHDSTVEWDDRIQLPSEPSAKVQLSVCASFEFSPMLGDGEVLRTVKIRVGDRNDNNHIMTFSPEEGKPVSSCSSLLITVERRRSHQSKAASDHDEDFEESSDLTRLTDQGHDALLRYRDDPRKKNVVLSVEYFERARLKCPDDHQCYAAVLCNLARATFINCQIDRGPPELSTSISCYRKALQLRRVDHPDRPGTLLNLAKVLLYRYGKLGFEDFPGEIEELASEVKANCFVDSHERRAADLALQTYALCKAISSGSLADIDDLIPALRQAVQDIPHDYFDKPQRLTNLSLALRIRYEFYGDGSDLDESIARHEEAMQLTSCGLDSLTHTRFLKEWAKATLAGGSWKDALVTAASFVVPRFTIYRTICEYLETIGRITDASECFLQMTSELGGETNLHGEHLVWALDFRQHSFKKLEHLGDTAMDAWRYDEAISHHSTALSLNPPSPQGILIKQNKARVAAANEVIARDLLSPEIRNTESTIEDIVKNLPRFRILCVGRAGVGKSSLINRVLELEEAKVSEYAPGEASVDQEFVSDEKKFFVLHDSAGFEPANRTNFDHVAQFLQKRHCEKHLKDRLHAIWLCIETPRAGGRVLEEGDKKLLALALKLEAPVVVVFTKYDKLVRSKEIEEEEEGDYGTDEGALRERGKINASNAFKDCVLSLSKSTAGLRIPMPPNIGISVSEGYEESVANLVDMTRKTVHERLKGDAWVVWAVAQRASLPLKIEACVDKGVNFYYHAFTGSIPGAGNMLLWQYLAQVHQDIVTCWNFKDENKILGGMEFKQLMLYLVQDVQAQSSTTQAPHVDIIAQFVSLIAGGTIPIAPPVSILGLSYSFVKWFSAAVLQRIPQIECLLMTYIVDLVSVLKSLFDFTLKPDLAGTTNWGVLKEAIEDYERSNKRKKMHDSCRSLYERKNQVLTQENFRQTIRKLLDE